MDQKQRLWPRVPYDGIVEVNAVHYFPPIQAGSPFSEPLYLRSRNLSRDGICLEADYFFIPNHIFQLSFELLHKPIYTLARVVWSERNACGMQFLRADRFLELLEVQEKKMKGIENSRPGPAPFPPPHKGPKGLG